MLTPSSIPFSVLIPELAILDRLGLFKILVLDYDGPANGICALMITTVFNFVLCTAVLFAACKLVELVREDSLCSPLNFKN